MLRNLFKKFVCYKKKKNIFIECNVNFFSVGKINCNYLMALMKIAIIDLGGI